MPQNHPYFTSKNPLKIACLNRQLLHVTRFQQMMIQYNRYAFTLLPNFYNIHELPSLQSNIIKESIYEKKIRVFFFKTFSGPQILDKH